MAVAVDVALLVGLAALLSWDHHRWVAACTTWLYDDSTQHLSTVLRWWGDPSLPGVPFAHGPYPPLLYWTTLPAVRALGPGQGVWLGVQGGYLALWMVGIYLIGRSLGGAPGWKAARRGRAVGLLAAALTATSLPALLNARSFMVDLPMAALVTLAVAGLLRSDGLRRSGWCAWAALWLAGALLTKQTAALWLAPPLWWLLAATAVRAWGRWIGVGVAVAVAGLVAVGGRWGLGVPAALWVCFGLSAGVVAAAALAWITARRGAAARPGPAGALARSWRDDRRRPLWNAAWTLALAGLAAIPWYAANAGQNRFYLTSRVLEMPGAPVLGSSPLDALVRLGVVGKDVLVGVPLTPWLLLGAVVSLWGGRAAWRAAPLWAAGLGGALATVLLTEAQTRYFLPASGLLFALVALGVARLRWGGVAIGCAAVGLGLFAALGWHVDAPRRQLDLLDVDPLARVERPAAARLVDPRPAFGGRYAVTLAPQTGGVDLRGVVEPLQVHAVAQGTRQRVAVLEPPPGAARPAASAVVAAQLEIVYLTGATRWRDEPPRLQWSPTHGIETLACAPGGRGASALVVTDHPDDIAVLDDALRCVLPGAQLRRLATIDQPGSRQTAVVAFVGAASDGCDEGWRQDPACAAAVARFIPRAAR